MDIISYYNIENLLRDLTGFRPDIVGSNTVKFAAVIKFKKKDIKLPSISFPILIQGHIVFVFEAKILEYLRGQTIKDFVNKIHNVAYKMQILDYTFRDFRNISIVNQISKESIIGDISDNDYRFIQAIAIKNAKERIKKYYIEMSHDYEDNKESFQNFYNKKK